MRGVPPADERLCLGTYPRGAPTPMRLAHALLQWAGICCLLCCSPGVWMDSADRSMSASPQRGQFSHVLARNIDGILQARREAEGRKSVQEHVSDAITRFTGSLRFVYLHGFIFGAWIIWNLGLIPGLVPFDPSFVVLAMVASVEAIFLSTFVLISQNRMQAQAEQRAELDLQISLLAEHEVTQLM